MGEPTRRTRIAIAYDCLFPVHTGGGERVYRRMAELFVERGAAVSYVTRLDWEADAPPAATFDVVAVWRGRIADANGTRRTTSALHFAVALWRHFVTHRHAYDEVIVAALPVLNVFAVWAALLGSRTTVVVDWLEVWTWRKWREYSGAIVGTIAWVLQLVAVRLGDAQTVNSEFTRSRLQSFRPAARPVVLGLVDLAGPDESATTIRNGPPTALFVGRHITDKHLEALPPALAVAKRSVPDLVARVTGTGPETDRARSVAREHGLDEIVEFLGRVDDAELRDCYRTASVLVNPSEREGFGLVIAEAAASATPSVVVAGEDNAAADLVVDGVNGRVADDRSAEVLGAAIAEVVLAGAPLRRSTLDWYRAESRDRGLGRAVEHLLELVRAPS